MNEKLELTEEEVNVYSDDCGKIQVDCLNDCIDGSAWLSIELFIQWSGGLRATAFFNEIIMPVRKFPTRQIKC